MSEKIVQKSKPLVITFRSHHNAYKEGDGSGATIIYHKKPPGVLYKIGQIICGLIIYHYILWFIPMLIILWIPYHFGYPIVSVLLLANYLRSFFNKDELKLGRPWEAFRNHWSGTLLQHYGGLEVVREAELDPQRKYIFGYHPHGILILSRMSTYGGVFEHCFPGIQQRCLAATPVFYAPGSREICLWAGAVRADKSVAVKILKSDLNLLVFPGGSEEIFLTNPSSSVTEIIARKGFIKLALQEGCDLVPTFTFGEKHAYHKLDIAEKIKTFFMNKLRTPLIVFWGRFFTWLPLNNEKAFISVIFGKPIKVDKIIPEPSDAEVDELYEKFYGEIRNLFNKYKSRYGYDEKETLVIHEAKTKSMQTGNGYSKDKSITINGHTKSH